MPQRGMSRELFRYEPVSLDRWDPKTDLKAGQVVRIAEAITCSSGISPRHVFVEDEAGKWKGMVQRASLRNFEG